MKKLFITVALLTTAFIVSAQNKKADSLIAALNLLPDNAQRINLLKQLSGQENDVSVIFKYAPQGIELAKKLNRPKDLEAFLFAYARGYFKADNYPKELEISSEGLELSKKLNDSAYMCRFMTGVGVAYQVAGENRTALKYLLTGLGLARRLNNKPQVVAFCDNISVAYFGLNLLDSAEIYEKNALRLAIEIHDANSGYLFEELGLLANKKHHTQQALYYYYQAVPLYRKSDLFQLKNLSNVYSNIANIYKTTGRNDSAFYYADTAYKIAKKGNELNGINEAAVLLSALYEGKNNRESLRYYKIATITQDSLSSADKAKQFQLLAIKEQQRAADLKSAAEANQKRLRLYGALTALALALVIVVVLWISNKRQQAANKLLQKQQDELKATQNQLIQSEKMASLGELTAGIAHEIQNPLNFVNNFSEVNKEMLLELETEIKSGNTEDALALTSDLIQNEEKINHHGKRADSIVKGMLEHSRSRSGEKEPTDLNVMADEFMRLSYHGLRAKDKSFNAELVTNFDANLPKIAVMQQDIGRVLLNLFNNAFYAVNQRSKAAGGGYKPEVTVATSAENGQAIIKVKDNGIGIPDAIKEKIMQPFFTTKPTGEGTGLGLSLTYDMVVKGHGGSIQVNSVEGEGSEFIILLPGN